VHQRAGERHLLTHALGEPFAAFMRMVAKTEPFQQIAGARFGRRCIDVPQSGNEL
jgi:hypothetical protein